MSNKKGTIYKKRDRIHLYEHEIALVLEMCERTRFPLRNKLLILMTYNHGLRASEVCNLKWNHLDRVNSVISIKRNKNGRSGNHPIESELELELLEKHYEKRYAVCPYIFTSEMKRPPTQYSPLNFNKLCEELGEMAGLDFKFTPHMLRHSMGTFLAQQDIPIITIRNFMGHTKLSSTELYIHLASNKFLGIKKGSMFA